MNILFKSIFTFLFFTIHFLFAVSAPPFPFEVEQPDGSKIPVRMFGHEYYNWLETEDGYVIDWVEDDERLGWYYSELDEDGRFSSTHILIEYPTPDNLHMPKKIKETNPYVREIRHGDRHSGNFHNSNLQRSTESTLIKPLVFLVDFVNLPSGMPNRVYSKEQFRQLLFEPDLESDGSTLPSNYDMSVRDYYHEISNGNLEVFGDNESIVDWTTVSEPYSYYVDGKQGTGHAPDDINYAQSASALVVEIAMEVKSDLDFSNFDGDGDGAVDVVILIVEGWGDGGKDQFWPHMSLIHGGNSGIGSMVSGEYINDDGYFSLNGVAIKKYIVIPEQFHMDHFGVGKNYIHPIGTICHEMGHVLGLPDLYDTSFPIESRAAGIGEWGLMGSGNWQRQTSPAYMSAWSRYQLGFINPIIRDAVVNNEEILLPAESGEEGLLAMILPMDSNMPQEYLILENRQKLGADQYLQKSGLLVWHIDETITGMYPAMRSINVNPEFYGVNLLQADGEGSLYTSSGTADSKDPFPGSLGVDFLSGLWTYSYDRDADGSVEAGRDSEIEIKNIVEDSDSLITFTVTNPNQFGRLVRYDKGGPNSIVDFADKVWAGILFTATDTSILSGVKTFIPSSVYSNVSDYKLRIYSGWHNNQPSQLICSVNNNVSWSPLEYREGGWIFISLLDEQIRLNDGEIYYIEFMYNGTGLLYSYDNTKITSSINDKKSYIRIDDNNSPFHLLEDVTNIEGNWNIRAVMSGNDDFEDLAINIPEIPQKHEIYSNYPNPFNPVTTLSIYLVNPSAVSYTVFDLRGRQIIQKEFTLLGGGRHEFDVNMAFNSSGVYFYQFTINDQEYSSQKMVMLK